MIETEVFVSASGWRVETEVFVSATGWRVLRACSHVERVPLPGL